MQISVWHHHVNHRNGKRLNFIILTLVALFIPLSVYLSQQEQDLRQEAAIKKGVTVIDDIHEPKFGTIPGELIVEFKTASGTGEVSIQSESRVVERHNGKIKKRLRDRKTRVIAIPKGKEDAAIEDLENDPNVESVEQDSYASILNVPNDPKFSQQYGLQNSGQRFLSNDDEDGKFINGTRGSDIKITDAWKVSTGKEDVVIAVLDTGIDTTHPDLQGKVIKSVKISDTGSDEDQHGHGTHVAGTIAANTNNAVGIAGICQKCKLVNIKVMGDNGQGKTSWITDGIYAAIAEEVDIINISAGTNVDSPTLKEAVDAALEAGIIIVAAAGNCGDENAEGCTSTNMPMYPAHYKDVISVTATDANDKKPSFASSGDSVDVTAPGASILSTWKVNGDKQYAVLSGTSMATPMVSGLAGLLLATPYGSSVDTVRSRIQNTADKIEGSGTLWQYGRINAGKALENANSTENSRTVDSGTPTPNPLATNFEVNALINGIGTSLPGSNTTPVHKTQTFTIELIGSDNSVTTAQAELTYDSSSGAFTGTIPVANITSGKYTIKLLSEGTLKKRMPTVVTISQTSDVTLPLTTLHNGDINGDNIVDIRDFNILDGCYSVQEPAKSCPTEEIRMATDLNDDGQVDGLDYNLFVRSLSVQEGD